MTLTLGAVSVSVMHRRATAMGADAYAMVRMLLELLILVVPVAVGVAW